MKVHEALARALVDHGVDTLFGLMGDANMFLVDSFVRQFGGRFVAGASEAAVVAMANGYAAASGRLGVATVTLGPGVTNTVTALVEGVKGSLPVMVLTGDTPAIDRDSIPNVRQREFLIATGAGFEQLRSPQTVCQDLANSARRAMVERRPIALNMPIDLQWEEAEYARKVARLVEPRTLVMSGRDFDSAAGLLAIAKRPIVLAGRGACDAESRQALLRLANATDAVVATTLKAKGLFRGESADIGIFGSLSSPRTLETILKSDVVIAFGASLNEYTTYGGTLLKGRHLVHVCMDPKDIGRFVEPDVGIVGHPALVADALASAIEEADLPRSGFRQEVSQSTSDTTDRRSGPSGKSLTGTVGIQSALERINSIVPANRVYVTDAGRFIGQAWTLVDAPHPKDFIPAVNYGAIGLGMPTAVGAAFANPDRPTLLVIGDGGLMLGGLAEFNTAVRYRRDLIVIVCNDASYGAEHVKFRARGMDPSLSMFEWPDFAAVAKALGGEGLTITCDADLQLLEGAVGARRGPMLVDVKMDPDAIPPLS